MKNLAIKIFTLLLLLGAVSCKKDYQENKEPVEKMTDLDVPLSFNWRTTIDLYFDVSISTTENYPLNSKLTTYAGNPYEGGEKLSSGSISVAEPFRTMIRVPAHLKDIYLELETSLGSSELVAIPISGNELRYIFGSEKSQSYYKGLASVSEEGPECDECDHIISGNNTVNIKDGEVYCVTESFTGNINFQTWKNGGTLMVCGTASISSITLGTDSYIIVTQGGELNLGSISLWGNSNGVSVYASSSLNVANGFSTTGVFVNHGDINVNGALTLQLLTSPFINTGNLTVNNNALQLNNITMENSGTIISGGAFTLNTGSQLLNNGSITANGATEINGSTLTNNGDIVVSNSYFNINQNGTFTNNGSLDVEAGSFNVNSSANTVNNGSIIAASQIKFNSGSNVTNNCFMSCSGLAEFNSGLFVFDNGYLRSEDRIQINSGSTTILKNGSMLSTPKVLLYANLNGQGSTNSIKATNEFTMSDQTVAGLIEVATDNLNILPGTPVSQHFINGATVVGLDEVQNFLAITSCNPEGSGGVQIIDTDNDGVPDNLDDFPNDPNRAFRSWYPGENTFSTLAFEDLWPGLGDFDFNDAVIEFQYEMVTNADNELVDLIGRFKLMAAGASFDNGFGVAIPVNSNNVASVTGGIVQGNTFSLNANGTEAGHSNNTVIIVYDAINSIYQGEFINTVPENAYVETDVVTVTVLFETPVANFGAAPFNPFIVVDQERGKEIHLLDFEPTELVDTQYFGIWEDDSNPSTGSYYKTDANLPWAIEIPVRFDYPIETVDILQTHLKFAEWANSGGTLFQDWYLNKAGYRNQSNIYPIP